MRISNYKGFSIDINRIDTNLMYVRVTENATGKSFDDFPHTGNESVNEMKAYMKQRIDVYVDTVSKAV